MPDSRFHQTHRTATVLMCLLGAVTSPAAAADGKRPSATDDRIKTTALVTIESAISAATGAGQMIQLLVEPELEAQVSHDLKLTAIGHVRADALDELEPGSPPQTEVSNLSRRALVGDPLELELRELYLEATIGRAVLTIGKQQIVWGQADGLKVLDVVNPQDFRQFILEPFSTSRIPLWSVNLEVPIDDLDLQMVWVPDQTYHDMPEPDAAYAFTSPLLTPAVPVGVFAVVESVDRPSRVIADSDAGVRVSAFWEGWDLTFNYFYHYDDTPVFARRTASSGGGPVVIVTPEYRRSHLVGTTFSNAFGNLTVRGEFAAFLGRALTVSDPADSDGLVQSDDLTYVIGLDWTGLEETLVSFQLFQSRVVDHERGLMRDQTETNVTLFVRHEMLNDTLWLETMWLHGVNRGDGLVRPKVTYHLDDHTTIWFGVDIFYGGSGGVFGQFDANDRIVLGMQLGF